MTLDCMRSELSCLTAIQRRRRLAANTYAFAFGLPLNEIMDCSSPREVKWGFVDLNIEVVIHRTSDRSSGG